MNRRICMLGLLVIALAGCASMIHGAEVAVERTATFATVDEALVTGADLTATNRVVHVIDRVLPPRKKISRNRGAIAAPRV